MQELESEPPCLRFCLPRSGKRSGKLASNVGHELAPVRPHLRGIPRRSRGARPALNQACELSIRPHPKKRACDHARSASCARLDETRKPTENSAARPRCSWPMPWFVVRPRKNPKPDCRPLAHRPLTKNARKKGLPKRKNGLAARSPPAKLVGCRLAPAQSAICSLKGAARHRLVAAAPQPLPEKPPTGD